MKPDNKIKIALDKMVTKIKNSYHPERVILFGSHAYGIPTADSDIDLLIIKSTSKRPIDRRVEVRQLISDPLRKIPIGLLVLTPEELQVRLNCGDQFIEKIIKKGKVLYAA